MNKDGEIYALITEEIRPFPTVMQKSRPKAPFFAGKSGKRTQPHRFRVRRPSPIKVTSAEVRRFHNPQSYRGLRSEV
jgi:hypothetical protein